MMFLVIFVGFYSSNIFGFSCSNIGNTQKIVKLDSTGRINIYIVVDRTEMHVGSKKENAIFEKSISNFLITKNSICKYYES